MTGGEIAESPTQVSVSKKLSYSIADILGDKTPTSTVKEHTGDTKSGPTTSYPVPLLAYDPLPVITLGHDCHGQGLNQFPDHFQKEEVSSPADYTMSPLTPGHQSTPILPFLPTHPHPPPPTLNFFQSPGYISLLLANHFAQPYLHHQRIPDFNPYSGRPLILGSKRKGGQVRFAAAQTARLEREFLDHKYLHANDRKRLAQALKLTDRQVKTWFQNRRAKWRKVGVLKGHRSESHVSASYGSGQEKDGYSPDQGRSVSVVSSILSDDSS